jgi:hypothetical protein
MQAYLEFLKNEIDVLLLHAGATLVFAGTVHYGGADMSDTRLGEALVLVGSLLSVTREHGSAFSAGLHLIRFHYHIYFILIIKCQTFIFREASVGGYKNWSTTRY